MGLGLSVLLTGKGYRVGVEWGKVRDSCRGVLERWFGAENRGRGCSRSGLTAASTVLTLPLMTGKYFEFEKLPRNIIACQGKGYRGIGLWGKVRGELGEYLGGGFGRETVIVDTILPDFKWILKDFEDGISTSTLDGRISNIICHMEGWFGQHEDILLGEPMDNQKNQKINKSGRFTRIGVNNASLPLFPSPTTKRKPVIILVYYKVIQESMKELENQYIYRMPSVSSIFYTYQICYKIQRKAVRDYASYATLDPFDAYYGEYCSQHILIDALAKLDKCASAILMGCYSGLLELEGPYIPKGAPIDYVLAGSPIVVGNLWVVRQTWALEFTKKLLKTFEGELEDEAGIVAYLDLARKTYNNLMYRAGTICYGVLTLLQKRIP
ncbi:separase [Tanacetum coccineum]